MTSAVGARAQGELEKTKCQAQEQRVEVEEHLLRRLQEQD